MKSIYFTGITYLGFFCAIMAVNPNVKYSSWYYYGRLVIVFEAKDSKFVGKAIARMNRADNFKREFFKDI